MDEDTRDEGTRENAGPEEGTDAGVNTLANEDVDFSQLSDEELDSFFDKPEESETTEDKASAPTTEQDTSQLEQKTKVVEPTKEATPEDRVKAMESEREKLLERLRHKEQFIQRRSQEIGTLRKNLKDATEQLKSGLEAKYLDNPVQATEDVLKIKENESKERDLAIGQAELVKRHHAESLVAAFLPAAAFDVDAMVEALKEDGIDPEYLGRFRADPYQAATPDSLIHLAKRAQAQKTLAQVTNYARHLYEENERLKNKTGEVMRKVDKAARTPMAITSAAPASSEVDPNIPVHLLSDEQLDSFLAKELRQGQRHGKNSGSNR